MSDFDLDQRIEAMTDYGSHGVEVSKEQIKQLISEAEFAARIDELDRTLKPHLNRWSSGEAALLLASVNNRLAELERKKQELLK